MSAEGVARATRAPSRWNASHPMQKLRSIPFPEMTWSARRYVLVKFHMTNLRLSEWASPEALGQGRRERDAEAYRLDTSQAARD